MSSFGYKNRYYTWTSRVEVEKRTSKVEVSKEEQKGRKELEE